MLAMAFARDELMADTFFSLKTEWDVQTVVWPYISTPSSLRHGALTLRRPDRLLKPRGDTTNPRLFRVYVVTSPINMQELEEAERYAVAALFTLALHSTAASAERYARDDWGEDDELYRHSEHGDGTTKAFVRRALTRIDIHDEYWGRDLAARGGFLDAVYWQLGLPTFKWQGLKALPGVAAQSTTPEIFRSTVRSLISVLDGDLAAALPAIPVIERRGTKEDVWKDIVGADEWSDDDVFDITTVHELGGGVKKNTRDKAAIEGNGSEARVDPLPTQLSEEMKKLELLAGQELHEDSRQAEYETLLHAVEEFEKSPLGSPIVRSDTGKAVEAVAEAEREANGLQEERRDSRDQTAAPTTTTATPPPPTAQRRAQQVNFNHQEIPTSAIAIAGIWELLQCTIGASFAASEAAADISAYDKERLPASVTSRNNSLKRQGQALPPCVRWYDARARVALKLVCRWLYVDEGRLTTLEVLLGNDRAPATSRPGRSQAVSDRYRYWKVGAAAVGGGALFAVTGGLAAPAIAAGVGSILGIVPGAAGAAAASAAGFLSTQAGVAALTTTMATAGAATTGSKMAYRTADVKDFGFYRLGEADASYERTESRGDLHKAPSASSSRSTSPVKHHVTESEGHITAAPSPSPSPSPQTATSNSVSGTQTSASTWKSWFGASTNADEETARVAERRKREEDKFSALSPIPSLDKPKIEGINLSTVIAISGWITSNDDYVRPWARSIVAPASDRYALVWCKSEMSNLTSALAGLIAKGVTGQAARYGFQHLLAGASGLVAALGPTVILGAAAGLIIDNAWTTAGERSEKAGKLLAHILLQGGTGGRPVTLVAHSMGAKVVMACMEELVNQLVDPNTSVGSIRGLVQDVLIMGTPVTPDPELFSSARSIVSGRFINCYSTRDWLLGVLFWEGISKPAAGLSPIDVAGIENVNCSDIVSGHAEYVDKLDEILEVTGMSARTVR